MIALTRTPIDPAAVLAAVQAPRCGGAVLFVGTVRDLTGDLVTACLDYEGYEPMAEAALREIADAACARWPLGGVAAVHRLGRLEVGEAAVAVAASSPHRAEAFAAAQFVMDEIKKRVPVWKREVPPEGGGTWVHPEGSR